MRRKGKLFVVSGPSGVGKGTLLKKALPALPNLKKSISCTTRPARKGEVNGKDYFFLSPEEFETRKSRGDFLEWANVYGNLYGTPAQWVDEQLEAGHDVVLEIDVQGSLQVKKKRTDATLIFILPPSFEELERRIKSRALDPPEAIERRLSKAHHEMSLKGEFHYHIVNDDVERAADELCKILEGTA